MVPTMQTVFHLGFLSRGGGGTNATIPELRGAKTFPSVKNDVVFINFIIFRGVWGYAHPGKFFNVSTSETVSGGF